ncbi:unnamed protein product [Chironomus riparius]|uniref:Uncharacterized protein n=1 Tax=Chironomus riparius TaxID=315576 RepID=A0A9N9WW60_9DIPT|nr:unnamed protein product [Chironomus riparius]
MKLLCLIISIILFVVAHSQTLPPTKNFLPCVSCANENKPICAEPTKGGAPQTFQSRCLMLAMDCGHYEPQYKFLYNGKCQ